MSYLLASVWTHVVMHIAFVKTSRLPVPGNPRCRHSPSRGLTESCRMQNHTISNQQKSIKTVSKHEPQKWLKSVNGPKSESKLTMAPWGEDPPTWPSLTVARTSADHDQKTKRNRNQRKIKAARTRTNNTPTTRRPRSSEVGQAHLDLQPERLQQTQAGNNIGQISARTSRTGLEGNRRPDWRFGSGQGQIRVPWWRWRGRRGVEPGDWAKP